MFTCRKLLYALWSTNIDCYSIRIYKQTYINIWSLLLFLLVINMGLRYCINFKNICC